MYVCMGGGGATGCLPSFQPLTLVFLPGNFMAAFSFQTVGGLPAVATLPTTKKFHFIKRACDP